MPNKWGTINSLVHKIRLHGRRGKGTAESFSREKLRQAPQEQGGEISCTGKTFFLRCDPGWCVHKPDVQNKWHDNTTHYSHIAEKNVLVYIARTASLRTKQKLLTIQYNVLFMVYLNNITPPFCGILMSLACSTWFPICCCCCHPICCLRRNVSLDTSLKTLQPGSQQ